MTLKPSRLRRLNQRLTLAKHKIKSSSSISITLKSLVVVFFAKRKLQKSIISTYRMINKINDQNRSSSLFSSLFSSASAASDSKLVNDYDRLVRYYGVLNPIESYLISFLLLSIFNAIVQSYSNNKY